MKLAKATNLSELASILVTINVLSAPMTFSRAKSKPFRSTPTLNMLFIIIALSKKRENMISLNITPMNIPMNPKATRFVAIGMLVCTAKIPILSIRVLPY